jgi:hypothetical protein
LGSKVFHGGTRQTTSLSRKHAKNAAGAGQERKKHGCKKQHAAGLHQHGLIRGLLPFWPGSPILRASALCQTIDLFALSALAKPFASPGAARASLFSDAQRISAQTGGSALMQGCALPAVWALIFLHH